MYITPQLKCHIAKCLFGWGGGRMFRIAEVAYTCDVPVAMATIFFIEPPSK